MTRRIGYGVCAIALAALCAGCANNRDYGREAGEWSDKSHRVLTDRESSQRTWVERDRGDGGYTERKYNARPYKDRELSDREYKSREYHERQRNFRDRDPLKPETLPDD